MVTKYLQRQCLRQPCLRDCAIDAANAAICQTAIDLAHRFGSAAVADGIETAADMQSLAIMGCDFGQGALIAPPMPQQRFLDLLYQRVSKPRQPAPVEFAAREVAAEALDPAGSLGRVA